MAPSQFPVGDLSEGPEVAPHQPPAEPAAGHDRKGYTARAHITRQRSAGPRAGLTMSRGGAAQRFLASHWRTRPFLSLPSPAPPPGPARLQRAARVDGSRRMLMRGRPPQPIGRPRSVGEVSAESQKNRAGPTAACSASGAGRALPARPATSKVSPRQPPALAHPIRGGGAGGVRRPGPRRRRLCSALGGGAFKGPAVGRTWGPPPPRGSP